MTSTLPDLLQIYREGGAFPSYDQLAAIADKDQSGAAVRGEAVAEFNINDTMVVTLTEEGAHVWNDRYARLPLPTHLIPPAVQAGYVLRDQLWDLMAVFGPHIYMGGNVPFEHCRIAHDKFATVSARAADALDSQPTEPCKLESNEQYNVQMAAIGAAAFGYCTLDGIQPEYMMQPLRDVVALYEKYAALLARSQPTDGGVRNGCDLKAVHAFLMGESPLEGVQFGDKHPTKAGAQWWRLNLRAALAKG